MKTIYLLAIAIYFSSCESIPGRKNWWSFLPSYAVLQKFAKTESGTNYEALNYFFESSLLKNFNGSILVAKNDTIIYEKYQGFADLRKHDPITEHTSFHLASVSKPLTAMAILQLVQEKKLSLDDSLTKFLPGLPYSGITIRMLLNHRSGLPNYLYFISESNWDRTKYITNNDVYEQLCLLQPKQTFPTNIHFSYSNTNFTLLALIIEKISGKTFPEYMKGKFFEPLGMKDTYIFTPADSLKVIPSFYTNGRLFVNDFLEETYGDKNVYTTPLDLFRWEQALVSGQLIGKALLDSAFTPCSFEKRSIHNYGLGWRMANFPNGKKLIYHFGRWHGFNAAFEWLPDEKTTIIILGNKFTFNIYNTAHHCCSLFGDYWQKQQTIEEETEGLENFNEPSQSKSTHRKADAKK